MMQKHLALDRGARFIAVLSGFAWLGSVSATERPFYVGLKGERVQVESQKFEYDDATIVGFVFGYRFMRKEGRTGAVEVELTDTISNGRVFDNGSTGQWDINTASLYAAYRSAGEFYLKGKVGLTHANARVSSTIENKIRQATGPSMGLGLGWRLGPRYFIEIEYTLIELDVSYAGLAFHYYP